MHGEDLHFCISLQDVGPNPQWALHSPRWRRARGQLQLLDCSSWAPQQRAFPKPSSTIISSTSTEVDTSSTLFLILFRLKWMENLLFSLESLKTYTAGRALWRYHNPRQNGLLLPSSPDWSLLKDLHSFFRQPALLLYYPYSSWILSTEAQALLYPLQTCRTNLSFPLCSSLQHRLILLGLRNRNAFALPSEVLFPPALLIVAPWNFPGCSVQFWECGTQDWKQPWSPAAQQMRRWHTTRQSIAPFPQL